LQILSSGDLPSSAACVRNQVVRRSEQLSDRRLGLFARHRFDVDLLPFRLRQ
jgi:hypothetical protein